MSTDAPPKKESVVVAILCGLGLAISFIALAGAFVPFLDRIAVLLSLPAVVLGMLATAIALARSSRLVLPALTLVIAAVPSARHNWNEMGRVWVESEDICNPPRMAVDSLAALIGNAAMGMGWHDAVGTQICDQLGRSFDDHDCYRPIGLIKCER